MKLSKDQKSRIELILAWRDFALAMNDQAKKKIQKDTLDMIEDTVTNTK